jgi:hypothetical protein
VDAQGIDFMNRWRTVENAQERRPVFQAMCNHYGDVRITSLDMSLWYTVRLVEQEPILMGSLLLVTDQIEKGK